MFSPNNPVKTPSSVFESTSRDMERLIPSSSRASARGLLGVPPENAQVSWAGEAVALGSGKLQA